MGITGQDWPSLAELLVEKGYGVHGPIRRASTCNTSRIDHLYRDPHERDARLCLICASRTSPLPRYRAHGIVGSGPAPPGHQRDTERGRCTPTSLARWTLRR